MISKLNCLKYGYLPWSYPRNWFRNIRQFFRNLGYAKQRIKYGFCSYDIWELHESLAYLLYNEFRYLAENHCGFPGRGEFSDENGGDDAWTAYLNEMAEHFLNTTEYEDIPINKEYNELLSKTYDGVDYKFIPIEGDEQYSRMEFVYDDEETFNKLHKQLDLVELHRTKFREREMHKAFKMLESHFWNLWD